MSSRRWAWQRRPRDPLHADDPGSGLCHAGLCPDRRNPFHRLRLASLPTLWPHGSTAVTRRRGYRRRSPARRTQYAAEGQCRRGLATVRPMCKTLVVQRTGGDVDMGRGRDHWLHEMAADVRRLPARRNERRRPAVHPLYVRLDRQPKGVVHTPAAISSMPR